MSANSSGAGAVNAVSGQVGQDSVSGQVGQDSVSGQVGQNKRKSCRSFYTSYPSVCGCRGVNTNVTDTGTVNAVSGQVGQDSVSGQVGQDSVSGQVGQNKRTCFPSFMPRT